LTSPTLPPLSPGDGAGAAGDVFRKQALKIEELEKENKRLQAEAAQAKAQWKKTEEELEELREGSGEVAELKSKADKVRVMGGEVEKLVRTSLSHAGRLIEVSRDEEVLIRYIFTENRNRLPPTPKHPSPNPNHQAIPPHLNLLPLLQRHDRPSRPTRL
jgi:seryl-tRNA synthetase